MASLKESASVVSASVVVSAAFVVSGVLAEVCEASEAVSLELAPEHAATFRSNVAISSVTIILFIRYPFSNEPKMQVAESFFYQNYITEINFSQIELISTER